MRPLERTTRTARSPEAVHGFVRDFDRYPEWITFPKEVTRVEGDGGPGTKYRERGTGGTSRRIEGEEGRREVHEGDIGIATVRIERVSSLWANASPRRTSTTPTSTG